MSFKDILSKLDQINEGDVVHKGEYGNKYGKEDVRDQYGHKVGRVDKEQHAKKDTLKKGRGRPKKDIGDAGVKFDTGALSKAMGGNKPKKDIGKTSVKHSLKEYFDAIDAKALAEAEQVTIAPAQQNTQVIKQGQKTLGTVSNPQLAAQIKQSLGKGEMSLAGGELGEDGGEKWIQKAVKHPGAFTAKAKAAGKSVAAFAKEKAHAPGTLGKQARLAQTLRKMHEEAMAEGDLPPQDGLMGAGLGAGRSQGVAEGKKPDFPDIDNDRNRKESISKAAQDAKSTKKDKEKVDESMDNRLKAAHHRGKAHALAKESYNCKYDDMEEARMYHAGFKEGLDECYGQLPIRGNIVADESTQGVVDDMASFGAHTPAMEDELDEVSRGEWLKQQAHKPGNTFKAFGQTFQDNDVLESDSVFESWDNQLGSLLEEYQEIQEGMTVSISKGQQGAPDSVSVTAQDGEADKLLQLVKHAGLGLFGDEAQADVGAPAGADQHGGVDVVGDHDGMMALIKKAGGEPAGTLEPATGDDYKDEEDNVDADLDIIKQLTHTLGGGSHNSDHEQDSHDEDSEKVDEVESEDQMLYNVAEDNPPDTGAAEEQEEIEDTAQANKAGAEYDAAENLEESDVCETCNESPCTCDEEQVEESYANADDDSFQADIDFMTKIISGGLNKQKSTGQTTVPVIAGQNDREGYSVQESVNEWKKLAGLK